MRFKIGLWAFSSLLLIQLSSAWAGAYLSSIPLDNSVLPADDLLYQGRILRADEAYALMQQGVDLSTLNPASNLFWTPEKKILSPEQDELNIKVGETVAYDKAILSAQGLFRFNVRWGATTAILHLDKTLHTMLLRKNVLRLMGYNVPSMKWLSNLNVTFESYDQMRIFLESEVTRSTAGASCRWVEEIHFKTEEELKKFQELDAHKATIGSPCSWKLSTDRGNYEVDLSDVAVTVPKNSDYINLSQGVPPQNLSNRTWRAALIIYALLDLNESVNAFEWTVGRINDGQISLPHFNMGRFSTSMDDARWMLNNLKNVSREELKTAIDLAYFPPEVSALLVEKIISRRNDLMNLFKQKVQALPINKKVSMGKNLVNGKLQKEEWEGYGSRFAWGDPESPFKDWHWYGLSKLQSILFDNLMTRANQELVLLSSQAARLDFAMKQFKEGLDHFVETGEFLIFPVRTWFSPTAAVNLKASRDIVVGNYLGTDNMVQLADSVGWSVQFGGHLGIENFHWIPTIAATGKASINKSWSHLKPLRNLKQAMKEPYRNIAVPLLKWQLKRNLRAINELQDTDKPEDLDIKKKDSELTELVNHLNKTLGEGESLLMQETISPQMGLSASTGDSILPADVKASLAVNETVIRRVQIYRKDSSTIQVYDDQGFSRGLTFDVGAQKYVPLVLFGLSRAKGDYNVRMFEVNINPDIKENPKLFENVNAIAEFIQTGSSELLTAAQKANTVKAEFSDKSTRFALLSWRLKKLKTTTTFEVESNDGLTGKFIAFSDEKQTGWNWEAFSKDLINFGLSQIVKGVEWAGNPYQNPAETIMGMGTTRSVRFEASLLENNQIEERFMRLTDRWEGWSASVAKVQKKMREANEKFGATIFNEGSLGNITKLKLFNVAMNMNLYEKGIQRLSQLPMDKLIVLENRYENKKKPVNLDQCSKISKRVLSNGRLVESCGTLSSLISQNRTCQQKIAKDKSDSSINQCLTTLLRVAYESLAYQDLAKLLGKENIFLHGSVNGFRNGDEILNDTIQANTEGRIGGEYWNGPFEVIQRMLGIQSGEFNGYWLRERL